MIFKLVLAIVIIVALATARKSRPVQARSGSALEYQSHLELPNDASRFKVATFNVQTGKNLVGKRDIERAAQTIANADLVGIQEVYAPSLLNLLGLGKSQTQSLAAAGGFGWLFCATRRRWLREHRGNALLSKLAISNWRIEPLPDQSGKSYRNMTIAQASLQGESFHIINTHLHTREGREEQLDLVLREFAKYPRAILIGDFNSRANTPHLSNALKNIEISDAISEAGLDLADADRIDWILTKGFTIHHGTMIEKGISDHPYYEVTLSINENLYGSVS